MAYIRAVHEHLDELNKLTSEDGMHFRAALSRTRVTRLTYAWRAILAAHHRDDHGRCPAVLGLVAAPQTETAWQVCAPDRLVVAAASMLRPVRCGKGVVSAGGGRVTA